MIAMLQWWVYFTFGKVVFGNPDVTPVDALLLCGHWLNQVHCNGKYDQVLFIMWHKMCK